MLLRKIRSNKNSSKPKLLIICPDPFGWHTGTYKYCELLKNDFTITYIGLGDAVATAFENIRVINVPSRQNISTISWMWMIFRLIIFEVTFKYHDVIFLKYFPGCSILKILMPWKRFVLDIRTLGVYNDSSKRYRYDQQLKFEAKFFRRVTVISEGIREQIGIPYFKTHLLPLGADPISSDEKIFESLDLLYVGTLKNRHIEQTIEGIANFIAKHEKLISISYSIVGTGHPKDIQLLQMTIKKFNLSNIVKLNGYIPHAELSGFFNRCNIGISYIPIQKYFDHQPPTKTFEYILSGLPCIATATYSNKLFINQDNGVLCQDNAKSFCSALEVIWEKRFEWKSENIRKSLWDYRWESIIKNNLQNYLYDIMK